MSASVQGRRPQGGDLTGTARRGRPRSEEAEQAILAAVDLLLARGMGPADLTVERIASTAGVGKATVYRRWSGKEALLSDVIPRVTDLLPAPDGAAELRDGLVLLAETLRAHPRVGRWLWLFGAEADGRRDAWPGLGAVYEESIAAPLRAAIGSLVAAGMAKGRFRPGLDGEFVAELLLGWVVMSAVLWPGTASGGCRDRRPGDVLDAVLEGVLARQSV